METINYKRMLQMALLAHYSDEGQCWTGGWKRETYGMNELNKEEKEALKEVLDEVGKLVGEEMKCEDYGKS